MSGRKDERILARARLALTSASFLAVYFDPTEPSRYAQLTYGLLIAYVVTSAWIVAAVGRTRYPFNWLPMVAHVADVVWLAVVTTASGGSNSPLFVFQMFILVAAAYRWGRRETVATAVALAAILCAQVTFMELPRESPFELNRFIVRTVFTLIVGLLLAHLAAYARERRSVSGVIAHLLAQLKSESSVSGAVATSMRSLDALFSARAIVVAVHDENTGRGAMWTLSSGLDEPERINLDPHTPNPYFFAAPHTFSMRKRGVTLRTRDAAGLHTVTHGKTTIGDLPPFAHALVASSTVDDRWFGRVFLLDPQKRVRGQSTLQLLQEVTNTIAPALHSTYLISQIRSRAQADERARIARDLHDTSIQALIAIEMELLALGRQTADSTLRTALFSTQSRLGTEVQGLRSLMATFAESNGVSPAITDVLAQELAQFQVATHIRARFLSSAAIVVPSRVGREILRCLQAALSNVRRHSAATCVDVMLERDGDEWLLVVEDNGVGVRGSSTADRLRMAAPRSMRERVTALGGQLVVERGPLAGVRVEVRLPARACA